MTFPYLGQSMMEDKVTTIKIKRAFDTREHHPARVSVSELIMLIYGVRVCYHGDML